MVSGHQRVSGRAESFDYMSYSQTLSSSIGKNPVAIGYWMASALFVPDVNLP